MHINILLFLLLGVFTSPAFSQARRINASLRQGLPQLSIDRGLGIKFTAAASALAPRAAAAPPPSVLAELAAAESGLKSLGRRHEAPSSEISAQTAGKAFDLNGEAPSDAVSLSLESAFKAADTSSWPEMVQWSPDSKRVTYLDEKGKLWAYSWQTGKREILIKEKVELYKWSAKGDAVLFISGGKLKLFNAASLRPRILAPYKDMDDPKLSPDGKHVAFVRDQNIWILPVEGGKARPLTRNRERVRRKKLSNKMGVSLERRIEPPAVEDYWWSPDSQEIAYIDHDSGKVPKFPMVHYAAQRGEVWRQPYTMPGDPLPKPFVGVVTLKGKNRWVSLPKDAAILESVQWTPQGRLAVETLNRKQNRRLARVGKRTVFTDQDPIWVSEESQLSFLKDGRPVYLSEKNGQRHIYIDGKAVTRGRWNVEFIAGIDEKNGWILYTGNEGNPIEKQIWRVSFDGKKRERLSQDAGFHRAIASPDGTRFLDLWSSVSKPPVMEPLVKEDLNRIPDAGQAPEFLKIPASDGTPMDAMLLRPKNFSASRRYPVIVYTYGGAYMATVQNRWNSSFMQWHREMTKKGFGVLVVDNRLSGARSTKTVRKMHKKMGQIETRDIQSAGKWLQKQSWVDPDRIGLWGWSFGGYMTAMALTRLKEFSAGVAVAPVTDWKLYNTYYTERRLGAPKENPKGYQKSSPLNYAAGLSGRLMLVHGLYDRNVHFQHTDHMISALNDAGKTYDLRAYPGQGHDISKRSDFMNLFRSMTEFFTQYLGRAKKKKEGK